MVVIDTISYLVIMLCTASLQIYQKLNYGKKIKTQNL